MITAPPPRHVDSSAEKPAKRLRTFSQKDAYSSPWTITARLRVLLWNITWLLLFRPTPKPFRPWRVFLLRLFGARITGHVYVDASTKIKMPWNLVMENRACLGPHTELYNLAPVILRKRCTIAQYVYFCGGTHDLTTPDLPLVVGEIQIGSDVFVGAKAFFLPGVHVRDGAVVGACSVVTTDLPELMICAGNPCRPIKKRDFAPNHKQK